MNEERKTYKVEEIFEDIPEDPQNCLMKIPPEISEKMGWKEGDVLKITVKEGAIHIAKADVKD
jgi:AbrB family looped-hinge helix DNA binding protein